MRGGARRGDRAFTLVELLAVMAIVSVLAALLLPAISRSRYQARVIQCKSNLRQIGLAVAMYSQYFNGWMPVDGDCNNPDGDPNETGHVGTSIVWDTVPHGGRVRGFTGLGLLMMLHRHFLGNPGVLYCPDDQNIDMGEQVTNIEKLPKFEIAHSSYVYRQLDARSEESSGSGRLGSLGTNPTGKPVRAIAADREYLAFRGWANDPTIRLAHGGKSVNVLFEDGHVTTALNTAPDGPKDLRLDMRSASPVTGTDGTVEQEMDRIWVLYDLQ